jgi:hypothetical protein
MLQQDKRAHNATIVKTTVDLLEALEKEAEHIVITEHLVIPRPPEPAPAPAPGTAGGLEALYDEAFGRVITGATKSIRVRYLVHSQEFATRAF